MGSLMTTRGQDLGFVSAPKDEQSRKETCSLIRYRKGMIIRNPVSSRCLAATDTGLGSVAPRELVSSQTSGTSKLFSIKEFKLLVIFTNSLPPRSINRSESG